MLLLRLYFGAPQGALVAQEYLTVDAEASGAMYVLPRHKCHDLTKASS